MSSLTSCNHCDLKVIEARYKKKKGLLVTKTGEFGLGGISYHYLKTGEELPSDDNFVAWFMELTDHCVC